MILVDTHVLLWWLRGDSRLGEPAATLLADSEVDAVVSAASFWEIAIKTARGKLRVTGDVIAATRESGFRTLAIEAEDGLAAGALPLHHSDPFDRMLVAQALRRGMRILTSDGWFDRYGVSVIRA